MFSILSCLVNILENFYFKFYFSVVLPQFLVLSIGDWPVWVCREEDFVLMVSRIKKGVFMDLSFGV